MSRSLTGTTPDLLQCTILLGYAAATLLPSVGAAAAPAIESAAVLSDAVSRADARHLAGALKLYEKHCRKPVSGLQDGSRTMFRMVTTRQAAVATLRDAMFQMMPEDMLLKDVEQSQVWPIYRKVAARKGAAS